MLPPYTILAIGRQAKIMIRTLVLAAAIFLACLSGSISAKELQCEDRSVVIHGTEPQDVLDGCEAVKSAARFFVSLGLSIPEGVSIELMEVQHTSLLAAHETGNYDAQKNAIRILAYRAAVKATEANEQGLGRITKRTHWRSYIVHELAHAAIHAGCGKACPSRAIHEYVAAVAQLASLPTEELGELLIPYRNLEPFQHLTEITEIYYAINPHYFAVKSYMHYQQQSDPGAFLRRVLAPSD